MKNEYYYHFSLKNSCYREIYVLKKTFDISIHCSDVGPTKGLILEIKSLMLEFINRAKARPDPRLENVQNARLEA